MKRVGTHKNIKPTNLGPIGGRAKPRDVATLFRETLRKEGISQAEFATRIKGTPAGVSRDLNGGLCDAKLKRLERLAKAISYEVVVTLRRKAVRGSCL